MTMTIATGKKYPLPFQSASGIYNPRRVISIPFTPS